MPRKIAVDIRTRFLRDDQRCYIMFPGDGYRYYSTMRDDSVVFLEIPGFPFEPNEDLRKVKDLVQRVVLSDRIAEWHREGRPKDKLPPRTVKELGRHRVTRARQQFAGLVRGFFHQVRAGDIIIVPPQNFDDDVLFGEVIDDKISFAYAPQFPKERIPVRKVRWKARVSRNQIPLWLERKIPSPNPLRQIENIYFEEIFDLMYERYFYNGNFVCKFNVKSQEFSSLDNFLFQQIVLYAAALHENNQEGNIKNVKSTSISVVVSKLDFSQDIPDQRISINSPGHIVVYSKNIIPLVAGVFMALSAALASAGDLSTTKIVIENSTDSGQISQECVSDIQQEVMDDMVAMGYQRWQELCTIEAQARKRTQISSGVEAKSSGAAPKADRLTK
ncbi:hypothetical protein [Mesorhizobium sp. B2-4-6]|uniref:hypothetical protein n=1 Tax=Mesorhizobium sp. B2-4-6 TaxID=2589943 RepID=UPI00112DF23A|nr:hypothetical protein [Mesorhizobium sp. B2-4-6]TPL51616.1 hypothetical protein FJ957_08550 [Mesorhizobium sp. B2-4-6]